MATSDSTDNTATDGKAVIAEELTSARRRSLALLAPLDDDDLSRQHSPLMSPLVWDLGHVGNFEELWLLRAVGGTSPIDPALDDVYDAFRHPRKGRPSLPLLGPAEARRYLERVRGGALETLDAVAFDGDQPLTADGFVYRMVIQHEHQHDETILATLQLMGGSGYRPICPAPPEGAEADVAEVRVPAGPFIMGTDDDAWAYDNERPAHVVDLPEFWIDVHPVTNRRYIEFVDDGGYHQPRWWTEEGWAWRQRAGLEHPQFWRREGGQSWSRVRFGWHEALPLDEPVQHVCWHEACAYSRWAGKRLPTEAEWEKAAAWGPSGPSERGTKGPSGPSERVREDPRGRSRRYPWGNEEPDDSRANLGQRHYRPAPVGAYPAGASAAGCQQMVGDVWEWTASDFVAYPGFRSFPYREYSEIFFDSGYKVLRGGSWATDRRAIRNTFRNWDHPIRRQIFAGFRCARDA